MSVCKTKVYKNGWKVALIKEENGLYRIDEYFPNGLLFCSTTTSEEFAESCFKDSCKGVRMF